MNRYTYRTAAHHAWIAAAGAPVWCVCDFGGRTACGRVAGDLRITVHESEFTSNTKICPACLAHLAQNEGADHER